MLGIQEGGKDEPQRRESRIDELHVRSSADDRLDCLGKSGAEG